MTYPTNRQRPAHAAYMAVKHMADAPAAHALKKAVDTVRIYRAHHPETAYHPPASTVRPGCVQLAMPMAEPSRSSGAGSVPMNLVTLPAPPWGGTFDRQGVRG